MERRLLIILGPTAVGKTDLSIGKALEYEYDHQNAILYDRMIEEGLF
jgi:tRNA A37 N6-isopentenylltransferase MiaA